MAVIVSSAGRSRVPAVRDIVLLLVVGFLVLQQGLPRMGVFAQAASAPQANTALGTAFTHQGRISNNGVPANGPFDMQVALFDSESGGNVIEVLPLLLGVNVVNGLYSVQLSFAESAFRGQERWLEVNARPSGPGNFTTFGRLQLTATPYALYAKAADWNGITNVPQALSIGSANCTNGQIWKRVGGTWQCAADEIGAAGTGDITGVFAGPGLLGGAFSGDAALFVDFGGDGSLNTVARSDHDHIGETWSGSFPQGLSITNLAGKGLFAAGPGGGVEGTTATDGSTGVTGTNTGTCLGAQTCYGVRGTANGVSGVGVRGEGFIAGISGESFNTGVFGKSGFNVGVQGESSGSFGVYGKSATGSGVYGSTSSNSASVAGVEGFSASGTGVLGSGTYGVRGNGAPGPGVVGESTSSAGVSGSSSNNVGVYGSSSTDSGVYGFTSNAGASKAGVQGVSPSGTGVLGTGSTGVLANGNITGVNATGVFIGVQATATNTNSPGNGVLATGRGPGLGGAGVFGQNYTKQGCQPLGPNSSSTYCFGVYGYGAGAAGVGVYGVGDNSGVWAKGGPVGIYAQGATYAGYFEGVAKVTEAFYARHVLPLDATAAGTPNYVGDTISRWTEIFSINPLNQSSDARMKTDIQDLSYGLDEVLAMRPVSFMWKEKYDDRTHLGLLAQDVQALIPEIVQVSEDEAIPLSMSYTDLIPVLIKAIQEQQAQIVTLRTFSEPRPSGALDAATIVNSPASPASEATTIIRQTVGPSNVVLTALAGAIALFALGLFAVAVALSRRAPR